jgi:hypothetical protein
MAEAMMKGGAIREFFAWYQEKFGIENVREMARRVEPAELRALLDPDDPIVNFLASSWYPARLVHAMLEIGMEGRTELEVERLSREAARYVVANGMGSAYRAILRRLGSPQIYARMIPRLWRQLHDSGDRSLVISEDGHATSKIANWAGHHPLVCMLSTALMCAIFEQMGRKNVKWTCVHCIGRPPGAGRECVYEVTWSTDST